MRQAREDDIEPIVALLEKEHRGRLFGLAVDCETFLANLSRRPNFGLEAYWVTEERGRVTGVAAVWDTNSFKQNRVVRYGPRMQLVRAATNLLAPFGGWGTLPAPGGSLRDAFVTDWAAEERRPGLLAALLERIYAEYRRRGYNTLIIGSAADDPMLDATRGFSYRSGRVADRPLRQRPASAGGGRSRSSALPFVDVALL